METPMEHPDMAYRNNFTNLSSQKSSHSASLQRKRRQGSLSSYASSGRSPPHDANEFILSPPQKSGIQVRSYHFSPNPEQAGLGAFSYSESSIRDRTAQLGDLALQDDMDNTYFGTLGGIPQISGLQSQHDVNLANPETFPPNLINKSSVSSPGPSNLSRLLRATDSEPLEDETAESDTAMDGVRHSRVSPGRSRSATRRTSNGGAIKDEGDTASPFPGTDYYLSSNDDENTPLLANSQINTYVKETKYRRCVDKLTGIASSVMFGKGSNDTGSRQRRITLLMSKPIQYIPATILGLLLNMLDAISYGMIMFPLYNPIFSDFGPDGVSIFFVSTIISQLVYSGGGSIFKGGNGSMMIEIVPFLHIMADSITREVGPQNSHAVIATTMVAFALSSVLTGLVFLILGACKLGKLIEFFPRHILVGCIGGVGWFLVTTGFEVSSRMEGEFQYNLTTLKFLLQSWQTIALWSTGLGLAIILKIIQYKLRHPLVTPIFFILTPIVFYMVVFACHLDLESLRERGWIFEMPKADVPWYHFYTYYDFSATNWIAIGKTIPAMLALTFFGILHVPINVPALGVSVCEDNVDTNQELVAHGISNLLAGLAGTIENYLVYTNSVLFIRSGGDSHFAGFMLAAATSAVLVIGPWIVGYIPVMVVGSLIFLLGIELVQEALIEVRGRVHPFEYFTIFAIIVFMSVWDFVIGIFIGIILACLSFVIMNSRKSAIRAILPGTVAKSAVRRHYTQKRFLSEASEQIMVVKLQGYLFFGTIAAVERRIRQMIDGRDWNERPIRYLIIDFGRDHVSGLDFSAAEAFLRIKRLLHVKHVVLVLCGIESDSEVGRAIRNGGLWDNSVSSISPSNAALPLDEEQVIIENDEDDRGVEVFESLNEALEWCENELLRVYYLKRSYYLATQRNLPKSSALDVPIPFKTAGQESSMNIGGANSPRTLRLEDAAKLTFKEERHGRSNLRQPLPLLLQTFQEVSQKTEDFFYRLVPYFTERNILSGEALWKQGDEPDGLYLIESGMLRAFYSFQKKSLLGVCDAKDSSNKSNGTDMRFGECILPGTVAGELGLLSSHPRTASLIAERNSKLWYMSKENFSRLWNGQPPVEKDHDETQAKGTGKVTLTVGSEIAREFISIVLSMSVERTEAIMTYMATLLG